MSRGTEDQTPRSSTKADETHSKRRPALFTKLSLGSNDPASRLNYSAEAGEPTWWNVDVELKDIVTFLSKYGHVFINAAIMIRRKGFVKPSDYWSPLPHIYFPPAPPKDTPDRPLLKPMPEPDDLNKFQLGNFAVDKDNLYLLTWVGICIVVVIKLIKGAGRGGAGRGGAGHGGAGPSVAGPEGDVEEDGGDLAPVVPGGDLAPVVPGGDLAPVVPGGDLAPVVPGGAVAPGGHGVGRGHFANVQGLALVTLANNPNIVHKGKLVRVTNERGGGKGSRGKLVDTDDPNYDCGKKTVASIIEEYFSTDYVGQAAFDLTELSTDVLASVLLSALYADVISPAQREYGIHDDLALSFVCFLALILARAVFDDILPPASLTKAKRALPGSSKGVQTAEKSYLSAPHHAELVEKRWGGTTHITVEEGKKISGLLREYVERGDTLEACRCIRELGVSFYHHEVVKRAMILGMEIQTAEPLTMKLLKEAAGEGIISSSQMTKGFARLAESLDDLALDIPSAKALFQSLVPKAISEGWLDSSFVESFGEDGEVQNGDEQVRQYKKEIVPIIHEYFLSDDIPELIQSLEDLALPEYNPIFLKKLITLAMDRKNCEKEMASVLLSALHIEIFSTEDIVNGFVMLLESAEDTELDILDASNELALFLARAVIDDVLAPLNLEELGSRLPPNCSATETVRMAQSLVSARHAGERLLRCWGVGTGWAVEDAKDKITKLLEEYESGRVVAEACQCIRDIGMPFFNHEVVKKTLVVMAMEKKNDSMLDLLQECFGEGLITINQMTKGFTRIKDGLDDLALDIPNAREKFSFYVEQHAQEKGWLLPTFGSSGVDGFH